jgi:hypothetical protein
VPQLNLSVDPTIGGWLIELSYIIVSVSCWRSARKLALNHASAPYEHHVWQAIAVLFFALCISRYLGLETALTEAGRKLAFLEGWYDQHRRVQLAIIVLMAISFIVAEILLLIWSRNASLTTSATLAIIGATFVVTYLMIRSISFHSVDQIFGKQLILGIRLNWILQLGGIGLVLMASEWRNKQTA